MPTGRSSSLSRERGVPSRAGKTYGAMRQTAMEQMYRSSPDDKPAGAVSEAKVVESSQTNTRQSSAPGTNAAPYTRRASFLAFLAGTYGACCYSSS